ncbi:hypothetical protein PGT21_018588 [Puccinia graminis f. sp. tritici]|uniref:Uncharacterized protein n=1 Tax=Puccinia graminis f. sp. tritici TaxID=56615 RepID=A0A5B0LMQ3_PUCGR|nr:hypothetical protein PGT21_018588 [Puccinia graminis f. sp. tritici]
MHPTIETIDNVEDSTQAGLPSTEPMISSLKEDPRDDQEDSDRSMEIGCSSADSLSLFRSFSMPIHISSTTGSDQEEPLDRAQEDVNQDEEDEDFDELLTTPTSQLQLHDPSSYPSYQSSGQRLLSCSLPPSLSSQKSNGLDIHQEYPLNELLQLTQPMREGVISRERLLPSSRMKQVGIGGRGRRDFSNQRNPGCSSPFANHLSSAGAEWSATSPTKPDQASWSPASSCSPLPSSTFNHLSSSVGGSSANSQPILVTPQFASPTPLVRPRPIAAWQKPHGSWSFGSS